MTLITVQDGKVVMRDDKVGTEQDCCCGQCGDPCTSTDLEATYQGETLNVGDSVTVGGNLLTEGRTDWTFECGSFETLDDTGSSVTFEGLLFSYVNILIDCEEEWSEYFFFSCANGNWTVDILRIYIDRESIGGASPCFDEFAAPCQQYWFDIPVSKAADGLPTGTVEATGPPDIEESNGGTSCGGGTFSTLTLSRTP